MAANQQNANDDRCRESRDERLQLFEENELMDTGEQLLLSTSVQQKEIEKLQHVITELQDFNEQCEQRKILRANELHEEIKKKNALIALNDLTDSHLKQLQLHQNNMLRIIDDLEASRDAAFAELQALKSENFQQLSENLENFQKKRNEKQVEIQQLREQIRQQDEQIANAMETHDKDEKLLADAQRKLEVLKITVAPREELDRLHSEFNKKENDWKIEKDQIMLRYEDLKKTLNEDLMGTKKLNKSISNERYNEMLKFQTNLKAEMDKNSRLRTHFENLQNQLMRQRGINCSNQPQSQGSGRNKKPLISPTRHLDLTSSEYSVSLTRSMQDALLAGRSFEYFASDSDIVNRVKRNQTAVRPDASGAVDSTTSNDPENVKQ